MEVRDILKYKTYTFAHIKNVLNVVGNELINFVFVKFIKFIFFKAHFIGKGSLLS